MLSLLETLSVNEGEDLVLMSMAEWYAENMLIDIDTDFDDLTLSLDIIFITVYP